MFLEGKPFNERRKKKMKVYEIITNRIMKSWKRG